MAKECCICENKIGFMEGTPFMGGDLCLLCRAKYSYLKDSDDPAEVAGAIDYFKRLVQRRRMSPEIKDEISAAVLRADARIRPLMEQQKQQAETAVEREKKAQDVSLAQSRRTAFLQNNHLITTGFSFRGYHIVAYHGLVSGEVVLGTGFLSEFSASVADVFGSQSNSFAQKMKTAKLAAQRQLIQNTAAAGGNAVIGVDFDYITFGSNMIGVSANGTAVEVIPDDED